MQHTIFALSDRCQMATFENVEDSDLESREITFIFCRDN